MSRVSTKIPHVCPYCHNTFMAYPSRLKRNAHYCSATCFHKARALMRVKDKVKCICKHCDKVFFVLPSYIKHGLGKYCSQQCQHEAAKKRVKVVCPICGKTCYKQPSLLALGRRYCSAKCGRKAQSIATSGEKNSHWKGGDNHWRGDNWKEQRQLAYDRDGGICQYCHKKPKREQNSVHHIVPFRDFNGDYITANNLLNLITLCRFCHAQAEHGKIHVPKRLF